MPFLHVSNITAGTPSIIVGDRILFSVYIRLAKCTFPNTLQGSIIEIVLIGIRLKLSSLCYVIYTMYLNSMSCFFSSFSSYFI